MIRQIKLYFLCRRLRRLCREHASAQASWSYWSHYGRTRDAQYWMGRMTRLWGQITELQKQVEAT